MQKELFNFLKIFSELLPMMKLFLFHDGCFCVIIETQGKRQQLLSYYERLGKGRRLCFSGE